MAQISITLNSNINDVLREFEQLKPALQAAIRAGLRNGLSAIRGEIVRNMTTVFRTTSADGLRQSVQVEVKEEGKDLEGTIKTDKVYAKVHEFGTVGKGGTLPDIVPVKAKALRFEIPFATRIAPKEGPFRRLAKPQEIGKVIFSQRVSIPARPFFFPAVKENLEQIPKQIKEQVDAVTKGQQLIKGKLNG